MTRIANYCPQCGAPLEQKVHSGRARPVCLQCDHVVYFDPKVAVVVFIVQDNQLLLIRRKGDPGKGKWALPAGFVDHDEAPETAAIRETLEETHLHVKIDQLLDVFPKRDNGLADIVIAYSATILDGTMQADDDADAVAWFTADCLPELVFYPSITLATRWQNGELTL